VKAEAWRRFVDEWLAPATPGFERSRLVLHHPNTGSLLRGLTKGGSSADRFCIDVFVQPLFVPGDHLVLSYGGRLGSLTGGPERWWRNDLADGTREEVVSLLRTEGLPFLASTETLDQFALLVARTGNGQLDPNRLEALVGTAILMNDSASVRNLVGQAAALTPTYEWEATVGQRIIELGDIWTASPERAVEELHRRSRRTRTALFLR
jgi:hypothetical protein